MEEAKKAKTRVLFVSCQGLGNLVAKIPAIKLFQSQEDIELTVLTTSLGYQVYFRVFGIQCNYIIGDQFKNLADRPSIKLAIENDFDIVFTSAPAHLGFFNPDDFYGKHARVQVVVPKHLWLNETCKGSEMESNFLAAEIILQRGGSKHDFFESMDWEMLLTVPEEGAYLNIGIHTGSDQSKVWMKKRWHMDSWALLINELRQRGQEKGLDIQFTTFGKKGDYEDADGYTFTYENTANNFAGVGWESFVRISPMDMPLVRVAKEMRKMDLFISNDSGLGKLATGLGKPVIGIYGPTDIVKNRLHTECAITGGKCNLTTAPCQYEWKTFESCTDQTCFPTVQQVVEAVNNLLIKDYSKQ